MNAELRESEAHREESYERLSPAILSTLDALGVSAALRT